MPRFFFPVVHPPLPHKAPAPGCREMQLQSGLKRRNKCEATHSGNLTATCCFFATLKVGMTRIVSPLN